MSGLEAVGIAASILQLADVGMKVSINLCTLYSKVRRADANLQTLSSEVALTCNVLHQLGELLKQDIEGQLCSQRALITAQDVLDECRRVFDEIDRATKHCHLEVGYDRDKFLEKAFRRMTFVFKEPDLESLRKNLDRLKSTMLLMLNVIMYAGQVRSNTESSVLQEQQALITSLIEMKAASEAEVKVLSNIINKSSSSATIATATATTTGNRDLNGPPIRYSSDDSMSPDSALSYEMWKYCGLIRDILAQVDGCRSELQNSRYKRIREKIWRIHRLERDRFPEEIPGQIKELFDDLFPLDYDSEVTHNYMREGLEREKTLPIDQSSRDHHRRAMPLRQYARSVSPGAKTKRKGRENTPGLDDPYSRYFDEGVRLGAPAIDSSPPGRRYEQEETSLEPSTLNSRYDEGPLLDDPDICSLPPPSPDRGHEWTETSPGDPYPRNYDGRTSPQSAPIEDPRFRGIEKSEPAISKTEELVLEWTTLDKDELEVKRYVEHPLARRRRLALAELIASESSD